tara:strand:+ start:248 stop:742 length:495 start_codon:yes stop_codon:yes gene_type:complete
MAITYKDIGLVTFPVYALPSGNWYGQDGLLFLDDKILDDKNMRGKSLGIRRLQTPHKNLFPIKHKIRDLTGLVKSSKKHFIDSNGAPFEYEKTEFLKLCYYKINKIDNLTKVSRLHLSNVKKPFIVPRPPPPEIKYAGVLHSGIRPWLLYDYSETKLKATRRKV